MSHHSSKRVRFGGSHNGSLYVQISRNGLLSGDPSGEVIKIAPDGTCTSVASDGPVGPYGIAIGATARST